MFKRLREKFHEYMIGYTPTAAERAACEKIQAVFAELQETRRHLIASFAMPEVNDVLHKARGEEDLTTWNFDSVFHEKLKAKGWPTAYISFPANCPEHFETASMNGLLFTLERQSTAASVYLALKRYKKSADIHERRAARMIVEDVATLEKVVNEMKNFKESDLKPGLGHLDILCGTQAKKHPSVRKP